MRRCVLSLLTALLFSAPLFAQLHPIPQFGIRSDGAARMEEVLLSTAAEQAPGFSLLVGTPDSVLYTYQTGLSNTDAKTKIKRDTPFYIASIGKTMTAFAILKLREEERIALNAPVTSYLPEVNPLFDQVTVMQLLTHQSGIPDYYDALSDPSGLTNPAVLSFANELDSLKFSPGHSYSYSNTAYVLLAEIIEAVSGMTYGDYLSSTFFDPLGMKNTMVEAAQGARPTHSATGYSQSEAGTWEVNDRASYVTGPGGIYSTVDDLYTWYKAIVSYNVVSKRWVELAFHMPSTLKGQVSYMSMGWFNETFGRRTPELEGLPVYGALGSYRGFRTMLYFLPQQQLVAILLENTGTYSIGGREIVNAFLLKE